MDSRISFQNLCEHQNLSSVFDLMSELRPKLDNEGAFASQIEVQRQQGYALLGAYDDSTLIALAGYRIQTNFLYGRFAYVEDLVVSARLIRTGIGREVLDAVKEIASERGCTHLVLDTALQKTQAQLFYRSNGFVETGLHFARALITERN
ncbi:GNAT family N-acetyltransferase [Caballeronia sordidicola]|uniref:GNAT family N-acetyltransferase n=1 Tax=Caballeronia sordidicola TaxID=196367 RepID=UPI000B76FA0E|nr:GNAT family N-acetyltransferase [Caballeronia sordidicola]